MPIKRHSPYLILILGVLTTVSPFSIDMYLPAFQQMAAHFHTSAQRVSLSLSSYFIGMALGQIFYGPFLDRFGRKRPLYFGLTLYVLASIACISSPTVEFFIACRFFQALGGCVAGVGSMAMVRDFFPAKDTAKIFSKLMLILSVSPLFAPTVGGFITAAFGWQAVFITLAAIVCSIILVVFFFLPEGHEPDNTVSLNPKSILKDFDSILRTPQFHISAFAGAFSFAGLFVYLAGAPAIFMSTFQLNEKVFGAIFAFLSIGVVGGGQFNILLGRYFSTEKIFKNALCIQVLTAALFLLGSSLGWYGLYAHILIFFIFLSCIGLTYPNAAAQALAPFKRNAGSAAAMLGFIQIGIGALISIGYGLLQFAPSVAVAILFLSTSIIGFLIGRTQTITVPAEVTP